MIMGNRPAILHGLYHFGVGYILDCVHLDEGIQPHLIIVIAAINGITKIGITKFGITKMFAKT